MQNSNIVAFTRSSIAGRVVRRRTGKQSQLKYFLYVPHSANSNPRILVSVHGISRNARQHASYFAKLAEAYGVVVVAPYFSQQQFSGYQRLALSGPERADLALQEIVEDARRLTGASGKIFLFGYSGGAQFAHRYAMAYPKEIKRMVAGAAGWYTFPDETRRYPFGTKPTPRYAGIAFDANQYLRVPIRVVVGGWDIHTDETINRRRRIDQQQGQTRLERASRWIFEMSKKAAMLGFEPCHELIVLRRCGHDFGDCVTQGKLDKHVFEFCFENSSSGAESPQIKKYEQMPVAGFQPARKDQINVGEKK